MDPTLLLTLGVILAATMVGAALRGLHRDRCLRNFVNTAIDLLNEALTILPGRARPLAGQQLPTSGQTHLKGLTRNIVGYVGTSYL